jgi:hypothetical protein
MLTALDVLAMVELSKTKTEVFSFPSHKFTVKQPVETYARGMHNNANSHL